MKTNSTLAKAEPAIEDLSPRELEVVRMVAAHRSSKEIGSALDLSLHTVNHYIASARRKWGARDRNDLARLFSSLEDTSYETDPRISRGESMREDDLKPVPAGAAADLPGPSVFHLSDVIAYDFPVDDDAAPAGLEALDRRFGKAWRIAAVVVLSLAMAMIMMTVLAAAQAMSGLT